MSRKSRRALPASRGNMAWTARVRKESASRSCPKARSTKPALDEKLCKALRRLNGCCASAARLNASSTRRMRRAESRDSRAAMRSNASAANSPGAPCAMSIADSISVGGALTAEGAAEDGVEDGSEDNPEHNLEHNKKSSAAGTQLWRGTGFYSNV